MTGRVRNFTEELFGALGDALGSDFVDNPDKWYDGVQNFFTRNREKIGNEVKDINRYLKRVCENNDITNEMLNQIFLAVRGVESEYSGSSADAVSMLTNYRDLLRLYRDAVRDFVHNKTDILDMTDLRARIMESNLLDSIQQRQQEIDEQFARELEVALNNFVNKDGTYNWDEIEKAMKGDVDTIPEAVLTALALAYLSMESPEDINRFFYLGYCDGIRDAQYGGDGTYIERFYGRQMTEIFQRIAMIAESVAVTTAIIYSSQYGDLSEEVMRMLRNAEMASYAVAYAPESEWLVMTAPDGSITYESYPCYASTDKNGDMTFNVRGDIEFSYSPQYIGLDDFDELIGRYAKDNRVNRGDLVNKIISDVALSTAIAIALTLAFPESAIAGLVVGVAIDTAKTTFSEILGTDALNESLSNLVRTSAAMAAYGLLGAEVYMSMAPTAMIGFSAPILTPQETYYIHSDLLTAILPMNMA